MIKKITAIIMMAVLVCSLAACGGQTNKNDGNENETTTSGTQNEGKNKYKNITAETSPIGVDNISVKMKDGYPYIFCTVHKNGGEIEESFVEVTLEILNDNNEYVGEETLKTKRSLTVGDTETVSEDLIWQVSDEKRNDEILSKYSAKVVAIKETDVKEAQDNKQLTELMYEIGSAIDDKEYNSAITMLEMAKEQYPDSKELKLFEAKMKDELAKQGISMDGSSTETTEKTDTTE